MNLTLSIQQIKEQLFKDGEVDEKLLTTLYEDERKGVQTLLKQYQSRKKKQVMLEELHERMTVHENRLTMEGYHYIAGIDEVGRGPLAGPVVTAAVILPPSFKLLGLTDSKKLTKQKRQNFADIIKQEAIAYSVQMIHAADIDRYNIYQATKRAMVNAVNGLKRQPDYLLVDAMTLPTAIPQVSLIKGDETSLSIAAGSVLAKVARDEYMEMVDEKYPGYYFSNHVGYGTKEHLEALKTLGVTPEHRRSFRPVKELVFENEEKGT
ncbi:ribonuclease HII [bacterium LRH843]|nr:ribonuclease HII [bacterium LRH843]